MESRRRGCAYARQSQMLEIHNASIGFLLLDEEVARAEQYLIQVINASYSETY